MTRYNTESNRGTVGIIVQDNMTFVFYVHLHDHRSGVKICEMLQAPVVGSRKALQGRIHY